MPPESLISWSQELTSILLFWLSSLRLSRSFLLIKWEAILEVVVLLLPLHKLPNLLKVVESVQAKRREETPLLLSKKSKRSLRVHQSKLLTLRLLLKLRRPSEKTCGLVVRHLRRKMQRSTLLLRATFLMLRRPQKLSLGTNLSVDSRKKSG